LRCNHPRRHDSPLLRRVELCRASWFLVDPSRHKVRLPRGQLERGAAAPPHPFAEHSRQRLRHIIPEISLVVTPTAMVTVRARYNIAQIMKNARSNANPGRSGRGGKLCVGVKCPMLRANEGISEECCAQSDKMLSMHTHVSNHQHHKVDGHQSPELP
jgi:hypothetical protein